MTLRRLPGDEVGHARGQDEPAVNEGGQDGVVALGGRAVDRPGIDEPDHRAVGDAQVDGEVPGQAVQRDADGLDEGEADDDAVTPGPDAVWEDPTFG